MMQEDYITRLEEAVKQMIKPLRNIPFNLVVESMTGKKVLRFDFSSEEHKEALELLKEAAIDAGREINKGGILRPRPIVSFEIYVAGQSGENHIYKCKNYKILSIESLSLDIKYEFNSDNKRMYSGKDGTVILAEGKI